MIFPDAIGLKELFFFVIIAEDSNKRNSAAVFQYNLILHGAYAFVYGVHEVIRLRTTEKGLY